MESNLNSGASLAMTDMAREEKRRQLTIVALVVGLFVSTMPVNNQRALFSPLGDIPVLGELSPVAYAITFGSGRPGDRPGRGGVRGPGGIAPPVAFAARVPGAPVGAAPAPNGAPQVVPQIAQPLQPIVRNPPAPPTSPRPDVPPIAPPPGITDRPPTPPPGATGAVPEPATWLTMILGFGIVGGLLRRARRREWAARTVAPHAITAG